MFFNRLGEMRDRSFENQRYRASGLTLVTAAIVLWNTVYLERAIQAIRDHGQPVDENLLQHVSPLGWEHVNLTGDYVWRQDRRVERGKFRPLERSPRLSVLYIPFREVTLDSRFEAYQLQPARDVGEGGLQESARWTEWRSGH